MNLGPPRPGWYPTVAAIIGIGLTLYAAHWQYGRATYKQSLQQDYSARQSAPMLLLNDSAVTDAPTIRFRRLSARGHYLTNHTIFLDNRTRDGVAGFEVITPLRMTNGAGLVLVNRGWIRGAPERDTLPSVETPTGEVLVSGTAIVPSTNILELSTTTIEGLIWQNLVLSRYREAHKLNVLDFVVQQEGGPDDGLLRRWTAPGFGVKTHQSYAVQWLLFASLIVFFYVYYGYLRRHPGQQTPK